MNQPGFYESVVVRNSLTLYRNDSQTAALLYLPHLLHKFAPWSDGIGLDSILARPGVVLSDATGYSLVGLLECGRAGLMSIIPRSALTGSSLVPPLCPLLGAQIASARVVVGKTAELAVWR